MKIQKVILTKPVTIRGRNIFGFKSHITFEPSVHPAGWYFYNPVTGKEIAIDRHSVECGKSNLYIRYWRKIMHVLEHILSIRYFGLDGVRIYGSSWPPYVTAEECWNQFRAEEALFETDENIKSFPINDIYVSDGRARIGKKPRMTIIEPLKKDLYIEDDFENIEIRVYIQYLGLGESLKIYNNPTCFTSVLDTYPQGYPSYRYYVCKAFSFFGWPHFEKVVWPQKQDKVKTLEGFSHHRFSDILGKLAMIHHDALPTNFRLSSYCSGHFYDLNMTKKIK